MKPHYGKLASSKHKRRLRSSSVLGILLWLILLCYLAPDGGIAIPGYGRIWIRQKHYLPSGDDQGDVALCAIVKDEHNGILEWIVYHYSLGVSKFYILDDGSSPTLREILSPFISSGLVEYGYRRFYMASGAPAQIRHYNHCLQAYKKRHKWIGFIDVDEFVVMKGQRKLAELLKEFTDFACVVIPWRLFGSSGYQNPPQDGVLQSYSKCQPLDTNSIMQGKSFTNVRYAYFQANHNCEPVNGRLAVNPDFQPILEYGFTNMTESRVMLHHYKLKSKSEFEHKLRIGNPMENRTRENWNFVEQISSETCTDMHQLGYFNWQLVRAVSRIIQQAYHRSSTPRKVTS